MLVVVSLVWWVVVGVASAGPGQVAPESLAHVIVVAADPLAPSRTSFLMGDGCTYTTSLFAQRVLVEGAPWSFTGHLMPTTEDLASRVAAPFAVGPGDQVKVLGTEVLDALVRGGLEGDRVTLRGARLAVDGTNYFVVTSFLSLRAMAATALAETALRAPGLDSSEVTSEGGDAHLAAASR